jgi:hypothetical protein
VTVVFALAATAVVFVVAAVAIGREARRLDAIAPRAVYEIEEAVGFVADRLRSETQARLTADELRTLLRLHMRWLHARGLQPEGITDRRQDISDEVVVDDVTLSAWLIGESSREGVELLDDVDVVNVVDAHHAYLDAIGAIGPRREDL